VLVLAGGTVIAGSSKYVTVWPPLLRTRKVLPLAVPPGPATAGVQLVPTQLVMVLAKAGATLNNVATATPANRLRIFDCSFTKRTS
jgi:hypothetical protein